MDTVLSFLWQKNPIKETIFYEKEPYKRDYILACVCTYVVSLTHTKETYHFKEPTNRIHTVSK